MSFLLWGPQCGLDLAAPSRAYVALSRDLQVALHYHWAMCFQFRCSIVALVHMPYAGGGKAVRELYLLSGWRFSCSKSLLQQQSQQSEHGGATN